MAEKRTVIIDTDPGIDDAIALLLAMHSAALDIQAITTVAGNQIIETTTANALRLRDVAGRGDIPVYRGAAQPLQRPLVTGKIHGHDGLGGVALPAAKGVVEAVTATEAIRYLLTRADPQSMTVVLLGPQTNLALALDGRPDLYDKIREIVIMGGTIDPAGGNLTRHAEFNISVDPEAASFVLSTGIPTTWVPIETARQVAARPAEADRVRALGNPSAVALADLMSVYVERAKGEGAALYDPLTIAWLVEPAIFEARSAAISVETQDAARSGQTIMEFGNSGGRARVLTVCNTTRFFDLMTQTLKS